MAHKFVLGHAHCKECGACLIAGFTERNHNCQARPLDKDVLRVMVMDMRGTDDKARQRNRTEFYRELEEYGFQRA